MKIHPFLKRTSLDFGNLDAKWCFPQELIDARSILDDLDFPDGSDTISILNLLKDENKLMGMVRKLKMKAFK